MEPHLRWIDVDRPGARFTHRAARGACCQLKYLPCHGLRSGACDPSRTLFEAGRFVDVRQMRTAFQDTMELRFSAKIEELTGREVIAFMSASHQDPDLALEAFVLRPLPDAAAPASSVTGK